MNLTLSKFSSVVQLISTFVTPCFKYLSLFLAEAKGILSTDDRVEICEGFASLYALGTIDLQIFPQLMNWINHDKKNENKEILFSLVNKIGSCTYNIVCNEEDIKNAIVLYNEWIG